MNDTLKKFLDQVKAGMIQVKGGGTAGDVEYTTLVALDPTNIPDVASTCFDRGLVDSSAFKDWDDFEAQVRSYMESK